MDVSLSVPHNEALSREIVRYCRSSFLGESSRKWLVGDDSQKEFTLLLLPHF